MTALSGDQLADGILRRRRRRRIPSSSELEVIFAPFIVSAFDRVLMVLFTLVSILVALACGVLAAGWHGASVYLNMIVSNYTYRETALLLTALLVLAGIRLIWSAAGYKAEPQAVVHEGSLGQVRIALTAIEDLVEREVDSLAGVREVKARLYRANGDVGIVLSLQLTPEVNVPEFSERLQRQVQEHVMNITGVKITEVRLSVDSITAKKPRVE